MTAWRFGGWAAGLIAGIVAATLGVTLPALYLWGLTVAGVGASALGFAAERNWRPWPSLLIGLVAMAMTFPLGYWRTLDITGPPAPGTLRYHLESIEPKTTVGLRGIIVAEPEMRGTGQLDLQIRIREIRASADQTAAWQPVTGGEALLRVYVRSGNAAELHERFQRLATPDAYGWSVEFSAPYQPIDPPLNPGEFDYAHFLRQTGADTRFRCSVARIEVLEERRGHLLKEIALAAKTSFFETYRNTIRSPASRLTAAATLGARRAVERVDYEGRDLATTLRHAGVGHVLAVSGLHVSVIAVMLFALFRLTGAAPRRFVPLLILLLFMFALLTGARPSSVRAVIMNSVVLIAIAYLRSGFRAATVIGLALSSLFILVRNPTLLFAPSFLLSYGAVLSLIVLAPPLDRVLCSFRGYALVFAGLWFAGVLRLAGWHLDWLIQPLNLAQVLGALWLLTWIGTWLNHRNPAMWSLNLERIPALVRIFFAAQLAIQFGMMIPLSAWFFGLFPVAGVLVNLLAIPLVGVLVQLGMLTGLAGLIPHIGPWLAVPLGAAASVTGDFFIALADAGARVFPFPLTPMPTPSWMFAYYAVLAGLLVLEANRAWLMGMVYRFTPAGPAGPVRMIAGLVLPLALIAAPWLNRTDTAPALRDIRILAEGRYPIVMMTGQDTAALINAGGAFTGGRLIFDSLRERRVARLDYLMLPSPDPRAGIGGATELIGKIPVGTVLLGTRPDDDQAMTEAVGDDYLRQQAARGTGWAVQYDRGYEGLRRTAETHGVPLEALTADRLPVWANATLTQLPGPSETPRRYASSARTPVLAATIHGKKWVIVTDTTPDALFDALSETTAADVLVVPNPGTQTTYARWLRTAVLRLKPTVLVIAGDTPVDAGLLEEGLPPDRRRTVFQTGTDGAVLVTLHPDGSTVMRTHRSKRHIVLPRSER